MKKDQEARILGNQALIMRALATVLKNEYGFLSNELRMRADDTTTFVKDYLK